MDAHDSFTAALADLFSIIGESNRLKIIAALQEGPRSVSEIMKLTGLAQTLVSFHLRALRETGVINKRREKTFIYYSLEKPQLIDDILSLSKHLEYFKPRDVDFTFTEWPPWRNCRMWKNVERS